jgi:hypothetical protein
MAAVPVSLPAGVTDITLVSDLKVRVPRGACERQLGRERSLTPSDHRLKGCAPSAALSARPSRPHPSPPLLRDGEDHSRQRCGGSVPARV